MQFSRNTSRTGGKILLIKIALFLIIIIVGTTLLSKIEFPYPNKVIEKIIPNDKIKIVK